MASSRLTPLRFAPPPFAFRRNVPLERISQQDLIAARLLRQGSSVDPVKSKTEGVARALTGVAGGLFAGMERGRRDAREKSFNDTLAQALSAPSSSSSATVNPSVPGATPQTTRAQVLAGNPDTAALGLQLQLGREGMDEAQRRARDDFLFQQENAAAPPQIPGRDVPFSPEVAAQRADLRSAGATQITNNVGSSGIDYGDPPKDFVWARDPDGAVALREDPETGFNSPVAIPVAGGPVARGIESGEEKAAGQFKQKEQKTAIVTEDVDRILKIIETSDVPVTGFGSLLNFVPQTKAKDVASMLDTVKAITGFDQLNQMRANSPTGGALGQVSELENKLLQSALGSLDQAQSKEQFVFNLNRVKEAYLNAVHGTGNRPPGGVGVSGGADVPSGFKVRKIK